MRRKFPTDVIVFAEDSLLHARFARANGKHHLESARSHRLATGVLGNGSVTPSIADRAEISRVVRRIRTEAGSLQSASLLLPDSWFRITILELSHLPDKRNDAEEVVRWALRRNLPVQPEDLKLAWHVIGRTGDKLRVLVIGASRQTLSDIESVFDEEEIRIVMIEPIGLNIWNAIAATRSDDGKDRVFLYFRDDEFTAAMFRGSAPVFLRSRNLSGERSMLQEVKLSASYVRNKLETTGIVECLVAGSRIETWLLETTKEEFEAPVTLISLADLPVTASAADTQSAEAEIAGCVGVFSS